MSAHTPGPWFVVDDAGNGVVTLADVPVKDVVVATLPRTHHANAYLIAAAPDLLAALKAMVKVDAEDGTDDEYLRDARAAIDKAEGQS